MPDTTDRRQFLKTTLGASLGAAVALGNDTPLAQAPASGAKFLSAPPIDRVRVGIIGLGHQGSSHLRNFLKVPGADVRVIWPSPADNSEVMEPGTYTVTGSVPGTRFEPKATVIVKVRVGTTTPPSRLVEAFPLDHVVLERDTKGRDTPFIRNW